MRERRTDLNEFYFANYRLLTDDGIASHESARLLENFKQPKPYTHSFTLRRGDPKAVDEQYARALSCPLAFETEFFTIHDTGDGWAFASTPADEVRMAAERLHRVVLCSRDYGDLTAYVTDTPFYLERIACWETAPIPLSGSIRAACEAGMVLRDGLPLHASLVEKDGFGVIFLGPSGMGKSTQAKLWQRHLGADFLIGDRPGLRRLDGKWHAFGMPWDGKDGIYRQASVPVRALIWLEQAKQNRIAPLNAAQAMQVMLQQAMMPVWDDAAMDGATALMADLAQKLPFYHLQCLPDEAAARLTYETIRK